MDLIVHTERGDADESRDLEIAQAVSKKLNQVYPNHYWRVRFVGHNLIIDHMLIWAVIAKELGREGACCLLPRDKIGTIHWAEQEAVKFAGSVLELFGLPRGPWNGTDMPKIPEDVKRDILARRQLRGYR